MPPAPTARLIAPHPALASCAAAYLARSTVGCGDAGGFNHYPATPFISVGWMLDGPSLMVADGVVNHEEPALPGQVIVCGPQTVPYTTYNPGAHRVFAAVLYADAMHALCGRDASSMVDKFFLAEEILDQSWVDLVPVLQGAPDDDARARIVDDFLKPRWQAVRGSVASSRGSLGDWTRNLALRAASSSVGRSVRHTERRVRAWAGLPMRTLQRMSRAEQALVLAREEQARNTLSWATVAVDTGYADQAHLARETRAISGLSPTQLARAMREDDSYWLYRIWS